VSAVIVRPIAVNDPALGLHLGMERSACDGGPELVYREHLGATEEGLRVRAGEAASE
jgi:hypothetical protein